MALSTFGWDAFFEAQLRAGEDGDLSPARVVAQHRNLFRLVSREGDLDGEVRGRLLHEAREGVAALPVVGDWVLARGSPRALIERVLERRTELSRKSPGREAEAQVLAANVDQAWIVMALDADFSLRRLERYLITVREGGVRPLVVLSKADLAEDLDGALDACAAVALEAPVVAVCALEGTGLDALSAHLERGETIVLLGSSGVGKSTLANRLIGKARQETQPVRAGDSKGRHTTTARELMLLESGALLIDTPGLRELQLWEAGTGLDATFAEVDAIAGGCRFRDCRHETEPGCAVLAAVEAGVVDAGRYESFVKTRREIAHLERRRDARAGAEEKRRVKVLHRAIRRDPRRRS